MAKRTDLLDSLNTTSFDAAYTLAGPCSENRLSFTPEEVAVHYTEWPKIVDLCKAQYNGPVERRGNSLIVMEKAELFKLRDYLDPEKDDSEIMVACPAFMKSSGEFKAGPTRAKLKVRVTYSDDWIVRYPFKPMDLRFAYLDAAIQPLFSRPSPDLLSHSRLAGNRFFITRDTADKTPEGPPFFAASLVCDYDSISGHARHFPTLLCPDSSQSLLGDDMPHANLSNPARAYLAKLGIVDLDANAKTAGLIWMHALAIGYSPAYLTENADGIRRDWPRIPLPAARKALEASAALGEQVAALLDTEADLAGVTSGKIDPLFKSIGLITKAGGGQLDTAEGELAITAGWGHFDDKGKTMPGTGKLAERHYAEHEANAIDAESAVRGMSANNLRLLLGERTSDAYLNGVAYWRNIPLNVWNYHIGGYQVIKKWLSYREHKILGRALKPEEAREVMNMARRIAAIILLQPKLDENYQTVKATPFDWSS